MTNIPSNILPRVLGLAALIGSAVLFAPGAQAGQCPADKVVASGKGQAMSGNAAKGVTDAVIASTNLAEESVGVNDRMFRLRKLVVQPGGVVPWHSHGDRPAIIYIVEGQITEYASTCAVPILHKAGEATSERHATAHWWQNTGKQPVVLLSADLLHVESHMDEHMM
ncbi:MAG TPA: cupin domain-containing protein [Acetobacteraceae bacterium]